MVERIAKQNAEFLGLMARKRDMMIKWNNDPDAFVPVMNAMKETLERLKQDYRDDPIKIPDLLVDALLETVAEKKRPPKSRR
jgi:chloramphenicol O-acetyltransferase